jgi:hypothetical protein
MDEKRGNISTLAQRAFLDRKVRICATYWKLETTRSVRAERVLLAQS